MTFNWPDIPFSGTEVDAFVVEYKALAQAIIDDYDNYDVNLGRVKLPFKHREDVKIFLEYGLTYAAFAVKQRAGNSGPGGDFQLSNSPLSLILPPMVIERLIDDTGPNSDDNARKECFENNANGNNPDGSSSDPDSGENLNPLEWYIDEVGDNIDDLITDECPPVTNIINETKNNNEEETCLDALLSGFFSGFSNAFSGVRFAGAYLSALTFKFVHRYIIGTGGVYTLSDLHSEINPNAGVWMREDIISALNKQNLPLAANLSATDKANYGMDPNGNAYVLNGVIAPGFKNSLGNFTVITDGTENTLTIPFGGEQRIVLLENGLTNISQIKQVRDDYGFNDYGYTNERAYVQGNMPGDPIPDDQIKSGTEWIDENTSPCEASSYTQNRDNSDNPKWNYTDISAYIRYIIASNHGVGRVDPNGYINAPCVGKPFAVHFDWR
jgi:hypothetical protein